MGCGRSGARADSPSQDGARAHDARPAPEAAGAPASAAVASTNRSSPSTRGSSALPRLSCESGSAPMPSSTKRRAMAAPFVVRGVRNETGANRIQMDVAKQFAQIAFGIDEDGSIPPLEQVPGRLAAPLHRACKTAGDAHHGGAERRVAHFDQQVHMVRHPAERVNAHAVQSDHLGDQFAEARAVFGGAENHFAMVATQDDVKRSTSTSSSRRRARRARRCAASAAPRMRPTRPTRRRAP